MADAAARILVHDLDELGDRVLAVADDVAGRASRGGDELAVDDQQAVIVALEEGLDDHRARSARARLSKPCATSSSVVRWIEMPRPWLPL